MNIKAAFYKGLSTASRALGRIVCARRGCRYHYADGVWRSWHAYTCVRCREFDIPLDQLPTATDDQDYWEDDPTHFDEAELKAARLYNARWVKWLPWPRWI